jgi:excisionase family DNA binding protein
MTGNAQSYGAEMDDAAGRLEAELANRGRDRLLTPSEVASLFRVDPKTVTRWAASGRLRSLRTPGGHRRFRESDIRALLWDDHSTATLVPTGAVEHR